MTTAHMPGRSGTTRATMRRNLIDAYDYQQAEEAAMLADEAEEAHNFPAIIWWLVVCIASMVAFGAGLALGSGA